MLEIIGLSATDQAMYESLVERPPATLGELGHTAATAARLEELGLITRLPEDPPRYAAVSPELGLDALIGARARELAEARHRIAQLTARHQRAVPDQDPANAVEVVIGREAVTRCFSTLQESTRAQIRVFDAPPYSGTVGSNTEEFKLLARGVDYRALYDRRSMEVPGTLSIMARYVAAGEQARVGDVPVKLVLNDAPMAIVPLRHDEHLVESALVVHDSTLLDALSTLFEMHWERAVPLQVRRGRLAEAADSAGVQRDLLPLLTAGLTDAAIAAHLGWSARTVRRHVRRHVHTMMTSLDAQTRFQAGYQAVVRGWVDGR